MSLMVQRLVVMVFLIVSCSPFSDSTSLDGEQPFVPLPDFPGTVRGMMATSEGNLLLSKHICVSLNQDAFWEEGDFFNDSDALPLVQIFLDNQFVEDYTRIVGGIPIHEFDADGNLIGIYGDTMDYCFTPELVTGIHSIDVSVLTTSHTEYTYSWEFNKQ